MAESIQAATAPTQTPTMELEAQLLELNYFHGFLPREELGFLLRKKGDFLIRCSEVEKQNLNGDKSERREYIISICSTESRQKKAAASGVPGSGSIRNNILFKDNANRKWYIYPHTKFDSLPEMTDFYKTNDLQKKVGAVKMRMSNPILRASWELEHGDIVLGKQLGHGEFGEVRIGKYRFKGREVDVAVKLTKGVSDLSKAKRSQMMAEARLMRFIVHPNVVRLYGIAVLLQPLYIVLELVNAGGLDSYLRKNKGDLSVDQKNLLCLEAAAGVEFIHSKQIIHRDLAARNCLVLLQDKQVIVKISDFGLSKHKDAYKLSKPGKLPIKWLAPEILKHFIFSARTDVWAYGIVVCEIFNEGDDPWTANGPITNGQVKQTLTSGKLFDTDFVEGDISEFLLERILCFDEYKRANMTEVTNFIEGITNAKRRALDDEAVEAAEQLKEMRAVMASMVPTAGGEESKKTLKRRDRKKEKAAATNAAASAEKSATKDTKEMKDNESKPDQNTSEEDKKQVTKVGPRESAASLDDNNNNNNHNNTNNLNINKSTKRRKRSGHHRS